MRSHTDTGALVNDKEEIAHLYGFLSYAELLDVSDPLPMVPGDAVRAYVARHPRGHWFIWEDKPPPKLALN
jgi:hypothetical protein